MQLLVLNLRARMYDLGMEHWWRRGTQEYNSPGSEGVNGENETNRTGRV